MIEVRHLELVEAVAAAGSITAATQRLHLTQPAISHALADLEERLGVALFIREPRGMRLTREGERLLQTARLVLPALRDAEHELTLYRDGCAGVLRISTQCYTCYHWLPAVLSQFHQRFPDVEVQIASSATNDPLGALLRDELDIAVVHTRVDDPEIVFEELFEDELCAVVRPDHPWARTDAVEPAAFAVEVLLLHADPEGSTVTADFLAPAGVRPTRILALQLTEAVIESVKAGLGVTVMSQWSVLPDVERGELATVRLGRDGLRRTWGLATRRRDRVHVAVTELGRLIRGQMAAEPTVQSHA